MKLTKMSLAAVVALSALSTSGFAVDLSEAIKGVDISGSMRYRFRAETTENSGFNSSNDVSQAYHMWRAIATIKTPVTDGFQGVISTRYDSRTETGSTSVPALGMVDNSSNGYSKVSKGDSSLTDVREVYGVYTPSGTKTSIMIGKMGLGTPVTDKDDDRGTGILVLNSDIKYVTLAAGAFDTWHIDYLADAAGTIVGTDGVRKSLLAAAALVKYEDLTANFWYFNIDKIVSNLFLTELGYKIAMVDLYANYADNELKQGDDAVLGAMRKGNYVYTLEAAATFKPVKLTVGYQGSGKAHMVSLDDDVATFKRAGERWMNFSAGGLTPKGTKNELSAIYGKVFANVTETIGVGLDYAYAEFTKGPENNTYKVKKSEFVPRATYKATKNLDLSAYYSYMVTKDDSKKSAANYDDQEDTRLQLQALYKF